jgi:ATP-binding cassette subfamily B protein
MGQANQPLLQIIKFTQDAQAAKFSMNKLVEINNLERDFVAGSGSINTLPKGELLSFKSVTFQYNRSRNQNGTVLNKISLTIPQNKVTVIIGGSGSGKTTLLKLLLKFYFPTSGTINISDVNIQNIETKWWRKQCGAILQDSCLFNDTVINNICETGKIIDMDRVLESAILANIHDEIQLLSNGYDTKIGNGGQQISQGQKQRIILARLLYKNPQIVMLDEATSALDFINEDRILNNLLDRFHGKTVIIVTHRINTAKYADNLVIMDKGKIIECGHPNELIQKKGVYYSMMNR